MRSCIRACQNDSCISAYIEPYLDGDLLGARHQGGECVLNGLCCIADMDEGVIQRLYDLVS